ncbi:holin [Paenisporosarcina cavernae]|uniref:Holin n=1 Tax=Paenisporosarcina cavernae TaxID=2320858 RepID=A0A385YVM5_9BACL|nr:holin [Paenisporosarcina cavernae]AYC30746.1 holin [Paenisporosarcina cavernae]
MINVILFATILVPIVLALVQLLKITFPLHKNYIPLIALLIGIIIGAAAYPFSELEIVTRLWAGGFAGLASTGLFELGNYRSGLTKASDK